MFVIGITIAQADMDWETMTIKVSSPDQTSAIDLLKQELYDVPYDGARTVGDFLRMHPEREMRLQGFLYEYRRINQNYLTDGSIEFLNELPLTNKIMSLLIPDRQPTSLVVPMLCPLCGQDWPQDKDIPDGITLLPKQSESNEYTGIVIDCRSLRLSPSLFPTIYTETMIEVYSVNFADLNYITDRGLVLFSSQDLYNNPRIGYNPLRIQALAVAGSNFSDIKISSFDARRIHGSEKNLKLLKECRVVIIVGQ